MYDNGVCVSKTGGERVGKRWGAYAALAVICAAVLLVGLALEYFVPLSAWEEPGEYALGVRINEIMASNSSALASDRGEYADWFEIVNLGSHSVNLAGYTVCENTLGLNAFTFPSHVLEPGQCVLVFADDLLRNAAGYVYHAPFRLQASGGRLILKDEAGTVADEVYFPAISANKVYYRAQDGQWAVSAQYTPGMANTLENHQLLVGQVADDPLVISEIMADNASYKLGREGVCFDYIELHNASEREVALSGYCLTDNRDDLDKWRIPDATIPAGGYLLVYATGFNGVDGEDLHADFKLSSRGEEAILVNPQGVPVSAVEFPALNADQVYSLLDGAYTTELPPTPGQANSVSSAASMERSFGVENPVGVRINEVAASTSQVEWDWVELYNASAQAADLSGYGLSDDPSRPRRWQFPQGTVIQPGGYLAVFMGGQSSGSSADMLHADFSLSVDGGYSMTLSDPDGTILDRMYLPRQYGDVSYGRADGREGFYYFPVSTPLAANDGACYTGRTEMPEIVAGGGLYASGETVVVEISAAPGARVFYTTDCTDPTEQSTPYTGPISISATTVVRARAFSEGELPSYTNSQSYFFGLDHQMRVVSLVSDPDNWMGENGIYSNFREELECDGHVEVFLQDGERLLSSLCGFSLHGADSRLLDQKNFKVLARSKYGASSFDAKLFDGRDYETYQSFILRCSSEDGPKTRMRDSVLTTLVENTSVMYQETELCVVYINGEYWGHYNMRERACAASICQFEGWEGQEDDIDLVKGNMTVVQGSDDTYQAMLSWVRQNGVPDDAALEAVGRVIDLENYIDYHAAQIFVGNADTLNVRRYRNKNADGLWRWVLYDLDWGFYVDTNSISRWLNPEGMGAGKRTDNTLFIALMQNATFRDRFLTRMGEQMATEWTTRIILEKIETRYYELLPELPRQWARWGVGEAEYNRELAKLVSYAQTRPAKLLGYFQTTLSLTDEQMQHYFGDAIAEIQGGA